MYPKVAAIGIAGPVENNVTDITNAKHWDKVDGHKVAESLGLESL